MAWISYPVKESIKITEIYSFFKRYFSESYEFSGETHNFWEFMYVVEGSLYVSSDEKVYHLSEGEIIFHKPLELHKFHVPEQNDATVMVFAYSAEGVLSDFFQDKVFLLDDAQKAIISQLIEYGEANSVNDESDCRTYLKASDTADMYLQNVSLYIYRLMLSLAENRSILPISKTSDSVAFTKAVQYMNDKIYDNPSVEEISAHVNLSVSSLKRIFSRYAGLGIHKYFLKLKLKTATELLNDGHSVTFVAEKLNFSSQGYFTKVFKRETGMLPSERS